MEKNAVGRIWPWYDDAVVARCQELIASGRTFDYYRGPELCDLEDAFAARCDRRHALSFNSGTSALFAAYLALGIEPGDEVLVSTYTFLAAASPLFLLGAVPVLCDSGDMWGNVTAETLAERLTERTRCIVVTHLYGQPCDMQPILALAQDRGIPVVADCSHAHGSTYHGTDIGHFGDVAVFSLGTHKVISGGLGGLLLCDDARIRDRACLLGHFKQRARDDVIDKELAPFADIGLGGNMRISPIAAVLALSHLEDLDAIMQAKDANARAAQDELAAIPDLEPVPVRPGTTRDGWYGSMLRTQPERRDDLLRELNACGIPVTVPTTSLLHRTSVFSGRQPPDAVVARHLALPEQFTYEQGALPCSEELHASWVALPTMRLHGDATEMLSAIEKGVERWMLREPLDHGAAA